MRIDCRPRRAMVLAAGLGTRLRPLSCMLPKPLWPVWGTPLIEHALRLLESWGVEEVAVNLHAHAGLIHDVLRVRCGRAKTRFSWEPEALGTGGALRPMREFLEAGPFWLLNADVVADLDPEPLLASFRRHAPLASAWVDARRGPRTVRRASSGLIETFRGGRPDVKGSVTFCGLQLVAPRIFRYLPDTPVCGLVDVYERGISAGERVVGVGMRDAYWADAGEVSRYLAIHSEVRHRALDGRRGGRYFNAAGNAASWVPIRPVMSPPSGHVCAGPVEVRGAWPHSLAVSAFLWPDPVLSPLLDRLGWPLARTAVAPLPERGSDRVFARVGWQDRRAIFIRYGTAHAENARYASHAGFLADCGVPAPTVLVDAPAMRATLWQDLGDRQLEQMIRRRPTSALKHYLALMPAIARLHTEATRRIARDNVIDLAPPFDAELFDWEHALFERRLLHDRFGMALDGSVRRELKETARRLLREPRVLLHRDLQSSNVMFSKGRLTLIDFQGMRLGPAAYDLASLLYDPYVELPPAVRHRLATDYVRRCNGATGDMRRMLPWAAVQRLTQALGAYGRLSVLPGMTRFAAYIAPAARLLESAASECGCTATAELARAIQAS